MAGERHRCRRTKECVSLFNQARPYQRIRQRIPKRIRSGGEEGRKRKLIAFPVLNGLRDYLRAERSLGSPWDGRGRGFQRVHVPELDCLGGQEERQRKLGAKKRTLLGAAMVSTESRLDKCGLGWKMTLSLRGLLYLAPDGRPGMTGKVFLNGVERRDPSAFDLATRNATGANQALRERNGATQAVGNFGNADLA